MLFYNTWYPVNNTHLDILKYVLVKNICCCMQHISVVVCEFMLFSVIIYAPESNFGYWNGGKGVDLIEIPFILVSFWFNVVLCLLVVPAIFIRCMIISILFVFLQQLVFVDLFVNFCLSLIALWINFYACRINYQRVQWGQ